MTEIINKKKPHPTSSSYKIDDYINELQLKYEKMMPIIKKGKKISDENMIVPSLDDTDLILQYNYNNQQLKIIAKQYKIKSSGNKLQLLKRIYVFFKLSKIIRNIQKVFRGHIQRKYNKSHGPAFMKREICTNDSDFLSGDDLKTLSYTQFFSFKDEDGFIYGFDIISLYNLFLKNGRIVKNPYNRNELSSYVFENIKTMLRLSKLLKISVDIEIKDDTVGLSIQKSIELRTLTLFQNINALGNYSSFLWFLSLNMNQTKKFMRELIDIWEYRAQIPIETKRLICPPYGHPFRNINVNYINNEPNIENIRKYILQIMENLVNSGVDKDSKSLGAYYVLGALTLVNSDAANALPWLFQSVSYF